ncbi:Hsp90 cochaperone, partial [Kickxella alabastrina]
MPDCTSANELKAQGNAAFAAGKHDEAIKLFTQAIELDPQNHVLYSNRSASLASLKKYEDALADAEKTVEIKPDWPKGYSRKGAALFGLQRMGEARETYEAGLKYDPENALLKKSLNDTKAAQEAATEQFGDIASQFSNVFKGNVLAKIAANPKTAPFLADPAYVNKINAIQANPDKLSEYYDDQRITMTMFALMGLGDVSFGGPGDIPEPAESRPAPASSFPAAPATSTSASKKASPNSAQKQDEEMEVEEDEESEEDKEAAAKKAQAAQAKDQGNSAYKARQFEDALEHYSKAIELDPTDITFWNNKSAVYFEMGKYEECIETAKQAVDVGRENRAEYKHIAKAMGRIGTAYSKVDNLDKAIEYYNRSLTEFRSAD